MKSWLTIFIALLTAPFITQTGQAQQSGEHYLLSIIHLTSGDVYTGRIIASNDTSIHIAEVNLGKELTIPIREIEKTDHIEAGSRVQITLTDESKYSGTLTEATDNYYTFENAYAGTVRIPRAQVASIIVLHDKQLTLSNPNSTRYFFGPSAIPLRKKDGYYQNAYLLANSVNFGITNSFTLGGGVVIPILFYITPKVGYQVGKNFYLGAGVLAATTIIPDAIISGGIPFGVATVGNEETNITLGIGYGMLWEEGDFIHTQYPITTINGMKRVSKRIQLVSENWIVPYRHEIVYEGYYDNFGYWVEEQPTGRFSTDYYLALSVGARIIVGKNSTVDFAPVYLHGESGVVLPYLDFVYKF